MAAGADVPIILRISIARPMEKYVYGPLDRTSKSIRIIKLLPDSAFSSPLLCELIVAKLDPTHPPAYEAVSYTWEGQTSSDDHYITCLRSNGETDDKKLPITKNCEDVLRHVRLSDSIRHIWIDSICIDQTSVLEKNHQVNLMGEIYTYTRRVLIWLGNDETGDAKSGIDYIRVFANSDPEDAKDRRRLEVLIRDIRKGGSESIKSCSMLTFFPQHLQIATSPAAFTIGAFWAKCARGRGSEGCGHCKNWYSPTRTKPWSLCGKTSIEWSAFKRARDCMKAVDFDEWRAIWDAIELFWTLRQHVVTRRSGPYTVARIREHLPRDEISVLFLTHIFVTARRKEATDPKDAIFALCGLCTELGAQMPPPEYAKSLEQIYCEATKAMIGFDGNLEVLYYVNTPRRHSGIPSWVPDWSDSWNTEGLYPLRFWPIFEAAPAKAFYSFDPTYRVLTALGKAIDAISFVGGAIPVFEESLGPWGLDIYDRKHPDFVERNFQLWRAVQGWAQCVQERKWRKEDGDDDDDDDDDDDESPYGDAAKDEIAFYYTVIMDLPLLAGGTRRSKYWNPPPGQPSKWNEESVEEISAFVRWNQALLRGSKERENDFLERDMIEKPGDLPEDAITMSDMVIAIWLDEDQGLKDFHHTVWEFQRGKTFFMTKTGWMGTVDGMIQNNDVVALIAGLETPFVLRPAFEWLVQLMSMV